MSVLYTRAVWASTIAPPVRWLLLALGDYADGEGHCWPSIPALSDRLQVSERRVFVWLRLAEDAGYVRRISGGGRRLVNHYWLNLGAINPVASVTVSGEETLSQTVRNPDASGIKTLSPASGGTVSEPLGTTTSDGQKFSCPKCGANALVKEGKHGPFVGCTRYPACRWTETAPQPKLTSREIERNRELGRRLAADQWLRDHPETSA